MNSTNITMTTENIQTSQLVILLSFGGVCLFLFCMWIIIGKICAREINAIPAVPPTPNSKRGSKIIIIS